ncbi:MAG: hypothetical protein PHD97_08115 [Bacteroidales bacterium]|nr:hypothetical protein [Bacteroidales bacterium]
MKPANILKIQTLDKGWSDKDNIMLNACFQLLTDCIENEKLLKMTDWNQDKNFKQAKKEIDKLYKWWKKRIKYENNGKVDPVWTVNQHDKDTEMLIRLVKIRKYLWT